MRDLFVLTALAVRVIAQAVVLASVMGGQGSNWGGTENKPGHTELTCRDRCDRCEKETGQAVNTLDVPWSG